MFRRSFLIGSAGSILIAIALAACDSETPTATKPPVDGRVGAEPLAAANPKASSYEIVSSVSDIGSGFMGIMEAVCPTGKKALGGGFFIDGNPLSGPDVAVYESSPRVTSVLGGTGWRLAAVNRTADQLRYEVFAICAAI
jgi:hypothetical protein